MMDLITSLRYIPDTYLGVATGKSRRILDALLTGYDIKDWFITQQVAENHPSKPHPAMILSALEELGVSAYQTVMIGDTSFDMEMAGAADVFSIGGEWGYHGRARLHQANVMVSDVMVSDAAALLSTLEIWFAR